MCFKIPSKIHTLSVFFSSFQTLFQTVMSENQVFSVFFSLFQILWGLLWKHTEKQTEKVWNALKKSETHSNCPPKYLKRQHFLRAKSEKTWKRLKKTEKPEKDWKKVRHRINIFFWMPLKNYLKKNLKISYQLVLLNLYYQNLK